MFFENFAYIPHIRQNHSKFPPISTTLGKVSTLGCVKFFQTLRYQGILKAAVSGVFEDLKYKITEGSDNYRVLIFVYLGSDQN